jgi:predicted glycosyltransferase
MTESDDKTPLTILFQPSNGIGLGHVSRHIAIAQAVLQKAPSARLPFMIEGNSHSLLYAASLPYIALPSQADLNVSWGAWSKIEQHKILLDFADTIIRQLQPHLILFDFSPCKAVVQAGIAREVPMALVVRKTKDMPGYFARLKEIQEYLSLILIPHAHNEAEIPKHLMTKTRFVGQIMRPCVDIAGSADHLQRGKNIVICGGGGGYPNTVEFYNCALSVFALSRARNPEITGTLIAGPLFRDWWKLKLVDGVRVIPYDSNLMSTFASADLIICQAGYNTIAEIKHLGVPAICVPADRIFDDQYERASQAANSSPNFHTCHMSDSNRLIRLIDVCLQQCHTRQRITETLSEGAALAADVLIELSEKYAHKKLI